MLPYVISYNASLEAHGETDVTRRYAEIAEIIGLAKITPTQSVVALISAIKQLSEKCLFLQELKTWALIGQNLKV